MWTACGAKANTWAYLTWTDLTWTDLTWTWLTWTDLTWTDLTWTWLTWTDLTWTWLTWTDLTWTDLTWTYLLSFFFKKRKNDFGQDIMTWQTLELIWHLNLSDLNLSSLDCKYAICLEGVALQWHFVTLFLHKHTLNTCRYTSIPLLLIIIITGDLQSAYLWESTKRFTMNNSLISF